MNELTVRDLHFIVTRLPSDVRDLCKRNSIFLGGGFIRETISGGIVKDIDLFGGNCEELKKIANSFKKKRHGKKFETDNAITVLAQGRIPVQFITRWTFNSLESCVESFDYTVCQAGVWFDGVAEEWKSCVHEDFYSDLAAKRLIYTFPQREEEAGGSIMRAVKFLRRGYNIQSQSLAGVMSRVAAKLHGDLIGNEEGIAEVFKELLIEVDPLEVIDGIELVENEHIEV